ncbi:helix-turn-helix protein [Microcella putealis]|uniref:Helix-turn-helix protein n=1 Tax=Microcella putealis TaxID=337005 RepID=A0A4Q7LXK0_9MICO|nr:helix-turn-helix domain-containing protein [Microcella putealis]RZS58968.1 helix-turn-helix protein [Microcella putealis]TQM23994.1 helix-turn-helix protein [Microcella putealis]
MSLSARNWAWDIHWRWRLPSDPPAKPNEDPKMMPLHPGEKLTLLCIAEHENPVEGCAYPSYQRISDQTGLNVRTVQRHVKTLAAVKAFRIERQRRAGGQWYSHLYYFDNIPDEYREKDKAWMGQQEGFAA